MIIVFLSTLIINFLISTIQCDIPCAERNEGYESVVCVCNSTYCDQISKIVANPGSYILYSTSKDGLRFKKTEGKLDLFSSDKNEEIFPPSILSLWNFVTKNGEIVFHINRSEKYQNIEGFGGAFTDSASMNFQNMSENCKKNLVMSYFSENGIEYNMGRVPIGGCDYSTRPYAYNMEPENDTKLSNFSLSYEDFNYKIPFIKLAQQAANNGLHLMAAAWSPPPWMKSNKDFGGMSQLLPEYYQTWADYHLKFLEEYDKFNISYWAISTGNEPVNGIMNVRGFNSLGWFPNTQANWLAEHFGPTLKKSKFSDINIITLDDQRFTIPLWVALMSTNSKAIEYVSGLGIHWYMNKQFPLFLADITHGIFKDKFLIATEAAEGVYSDEDKKGVVLGAWYCAESYIKDIIEDLNHWFVGWLDWNLLLNRKGGPNWYNNTADASVIALQDKDEFLKQPIFYAIGHFSKFIPRGSKRVAVEQVSGDEVEKVAFLRPDGGIAVVFHNKYSKPQKVIVKEHGKRLVSLTVPANSIHTLVYW